MNYHQKWHIKLLKRLQDLKNEGKAFSQESRDEYLELAKYDRAIQSYEFLVVKNLATALLNSV